MALSLVTARAQIFVGGVGITNNFTNAPIQNNLVPQTNSLSAGLAPRNLQVQNISTNETIIGAYGWLVATQTGTNFYFSSVFTNNFPLTNGIVQGGTWTTNFPGQTAIISVVPYGFLSVSNGSNIVTFF